MAERVPVSVVPQMAVPHQLQYLDAMGLRAWTARYQLPHAAETSACEWAEVAAVPDAAEPPTQRLQSLIDEAPASTPSVSSALTAVRRSEGVSGRFKALLEDEAGVSANTALPKAGHLAASDSQSIGDEQTSSIMQAALRFTLQVTVLERRWLVALVQPVMPNIHEQRLLAAMLSSVGIQPAERVSFIDFQWPMMEGLLTESPLIEAQQGIKAFLEGRAHEGLSLEKLVLFGDSEAEAMNAFRQVLDIDGVQSGLLSLPVWQAPSLASLLVSAECKAELWPALHALGQDWQASVEPKASSST